MPREMTLIQVSHNMEVAHRLWETPGKCQNIHGHSMRVILAARGYTDGHGLCMGLDFGDLKKVFRHYLDTTFDHRLLLNAADPWTGMFGVERQDDRLPGLRCMEGDPTTENLAMWIGKYMLREQLDDIPDFVGVRCTVWETAVNSARWEYVKSVVKVGTSASA